MLKIDTSTSLRCSARITASFAACMQQTAEQNGLPTCVSRDPTHWRKARRFGSVWSDGRKTWPCVGPEALRSRSHSMLVSTFGEVP